jgi:hypothetical protein
MIIGTNLLWDSPDVRADALLDGIETIRQENTRLGSPLYANIDVNKFAVGGWSMGGGGAQLAAVIDPSLKAVIALCPWLDNLNLQSQDLNHQVPVLIFSGELDIIAPPSIHADVHYDYTPENTHKLLFEIDNGNHSVANNPLEGQGEVGETALLWLENYLLGDLSNCSLLLETPISSSKYLTNVECENEILGDVNHDGSVNVQDVILIVNLILNDENDNQADLNSDGLINVLDVIQLVGIILNN